MSPGSRYRITATGIVPDFHRYSLLIRPLAEPFCGTNLQQGAEFSNSFLYNAGLRRKNVSCRKFKTTQLKRLILFVALLCTATGSYAQHILNKTVSVNAVRQPVSVVLDNIGRQGNFHFSYIRDFIKDDSLVTIKANGKTVKQVLDQLFQGNCVYREMGDQLILQRASKEKWFVVSGYIHDGITGTPVNNASVYERMQLVSTMSNDQGYFRLRLKEKDRPMLTSITVSKDLYMDTIMFISSGYDQEISATIKPANPIQLSVVDVNQFKHVEATWLGSFFLSSRQRVQSLNISDFFTRQPYQYSIIPGAGTHGKMGAQVVNKISLNMLGGYTAGLNGVEVAGIFNIDKKDVQYVQAAGIFNMVGGKFTGVQVAGAFNMLLDSMTGVQASGVANVLKKDLTGVQASAGFNSVGGNIEGGQFTAGVNLARGKVEGVQVAAIYNAAKKVEGVQASAIANYTDTLDGVQIGLVNIADSSDGYSIGLFNFVRKGYRELQVYNNEIGTLNVAFKSGNHKLYSIFMMGANLNMQQKAFSYGFGMGHLFKPGISLEFISQVVYLGDWETTQSVNRLQVGYNYKIGRHVNLFGGPAVSLGFGNEKMVPVKGYKSGLPGDVWLGWHIGVGFF
jgi:hypothetical protein